MVIAAFLLSLFLFFVRLAEGNYAVRQERDEHRHQEVGEDEEVMDVFSELPVCLGALLIAVKVYERRHPLIKLQGVVNDEHCGERHEDAPDLP